MHKQGCHIDGVISWSTAVRLSPAAALPFRPGLHHHQHPPAPSAALPQDDGKRISTTAISPPGRPPIILPRRPGKILKVVSSTHRGGTWDPCPPPCRASRSAGGGRERILFWQPDRNHRMPEFCSTASDYNGYRDQTCSGRVRPGPGRSLLLNAILQSQQVKVYGQVAMDL
jgi:hypothetical protein